MAKHRISLDEQFPPSSGSSGGSRVNGLQSRPDFICPGQWHRVDFLLSSQTMKLTLDGDQKFEYPVRLTRAALEDILSLPVHVGGSAGIVGGNGDLCKAA